MGFDIGAVIANLLMAYLASAGHERKPGERRLFEAWVLETVEKVWSGVRPQVPRSVADASRRRCLSRALFEGEPERRTGGRAAGLYGPAVRDTVGFAAAKIIRRMLGLAHNIDFELIKDPKRRGDLRGAQPAARARHDGGYGVIPAPSAPSQSGAAGARLAAGFWR